MLPDSSFSLGNAYAQGGVPSVGVFAYLSARDWRHFLKVQEELLLQIMALAQAKGARSRPSQTVYLAQTAEEGSVGGLSKALPAAHSVLMFKAAFRRR